ncbi:MAG: EamA family transporter [Nitriliruptorales bacterium]|nr:EamA family transporter [Nitriliruptorales bacterium]
MSILLALTAAASWGTSDFLGGLAGRRAGDDSVLSILVVTQAIGFVPTLLAALLVAGEMTSRDVLVGVASGVVGMAGVGALYRGLRIGKMGVVAPITGAIAAAIPVVASVLQGELPSALAWTGIALALIAIVLVSSDRVAPATPTAGALPPGLIEAIAAGLGFGLIFLLLDLTTPDSGLWPLIVLRGVGTGIVAVAAVVVGQRLTAPTGTGSILVGVGLFDSLATITYLFATREGLLAVVAVIASLYPVATVVWARAALDERLARHQQGGLVLALGAVALIGIG